MYICIYLYVDLNVHTNIFPFERLASMQMVCENVHHQMDKPVALWLSLTHSTHNADQITHPYPLYPETTPPPPIHTHPRQLWGSA